MPTPEPVPYYSHVTQHGQDALWIGFIVFLLSTMVIGVMASRLDLKHRVFHVLLFLITAISCLSYFSMATGSGYKYINTGEHVIQGQLTPVFRQVFWVREVDYALTSPLLVLVLALLAGLPWFSVITLLLIDEAMILAALFSALHPHRNAAKWVWFTIGCLSLLYILVTLAWHGRQCAKHRHASISRLYIQLALYTIILWLIYPFIFAFSEGSARISPDGDAIAYTVLDIFAKAGFAFWVLLRHKHENEHESAVVMPKSWTEPRGGAGAIQLPVSDKCCCNAGLC
ncbi:family A G protein-coupled receptor-like protein [Ramaria rubella]|nr:family A G protein-coupled receptor-like protein [Ramaria rubella]